MRGEKVNNKCDKSKRKRLESTRIELGWEEEKIGKDNQAKKDQEEERLR